MKNAKTQIITAVIAALATILAAWIGKWNFNTPEKENSQPLENTEQVISNQQNQAGKVENNQINVQGDYVKGDKLESRPKEVYQTKPTPKKEVIDSSKNEASRKYENSGSGTQINIEEMKAPLTLNTVEPPPPAFKLVNFEKEEGLFVNKSPNHNSKAKTEFKFKIKIEFNYSSSLSKNEMAIAFAVKTKYHINFHKKGSSFFMGGAGGLDSLGNAKSCFMTNPVNGIYEVEILTNENIQDPPSCLLIRLDQDKIYRISK